MSENLLQVVDLEKAFGAKQLLSGAKLSVNSGEHVGVIGVNGAGKSTLFKIILGKVAADAGRVILKSGLRLSALSQHDEWPPELTGNEWLQQLSHANALPLWDVKALGRDLSLSESTLNQPVGSLSGGYRMRIKLLSLLINDPELLLLDEPTNYLDLETTLLLERFLQNFNGAFMLISHDREFLRRTTDHTVEIEMGEITKYPGHIDDYFEQKELIKSQLVARAESLEQKRARILDFVSRFGAKATKAKQAQSRLKQLEKMEVIEVSPLPAMARIQIPPPQATGTQNLVMEQVHVGYANRKILSDVNLRMKRGEHWAVVGYNGAGKSTLLKTLAGRLPVLAGNLVWGMDVRTAFFHQHVVEELNPQHTVLKSLEEGADATVTTAEIKAMAGSLLFSGEDLHKSISVLSGGEMARVALARCLLSRAPLLILDEPTNHLDFQTVESLTEALRNYPGSLIFVSHDRSFVRRIATQIVEIKEGRANFYPGSFDDYVWHVQQNEQAAVQLAKVPVQTAKIKPDNFRETEKRKRTLLREIEKAEANIKGLEETIAEINQKLSQFNGATNELQQLTELLATNLQKLEETELQWLQLQEEQLQLTQKE